MASDVPWVAPQPANVVQGPSGDVLTWTSVYQTPEPASLAVQERFTM